LIRWQIGVPGFDDQISRITGGSMDAASARRLWVVGETIHALLYFAPQVDQALRAAGARGFWDGYFAGRAAPLGPVDEPVVTATFYNFHPAMVARSIPSVWDRLPPTVAVHTRLTGIDRTLAALPNAAAAIGAAGAARSTLMVAVDTADRAGRPLFAANAALPLPDAPHLAVWQSLTSLREHRGDGHHAALVANGIDGCQAHVLAGAAGGTPWTVLQPTRGWSDADYDDAVDGLSARGIVTGDGTITAEGRALHAHIEDTTDRLALAPWTALGDAGIETAIAALHPLASVIDRAAVIRQPNPMGLPPVPD
jgi:hypothetical protein